MGFRDIDTKDPQQVFEVVSAVYSGLFPKGDRQFVSKSFGWLTDWFTGRYKDYQAIDACYHDFEHTLQGTLCLARLLDGRHRADADPKVSQRMFELSTLAIMLHDTGYLKHADDTEGTGAKYTLIHVDRSAGFAEQFMIEQGFSARDVRAVRNMIHCTGVATKLEEIPFGDKTERLMGFAVATSDLLGQMADKDYVKKLRFLYNEFSEAAAFHPDRPGYVHKFESLEQLYRDTPGFWELYVKPKITNHCKCLYKYLNEPYPEGENPYIKRIEANVDKVRKMNEKK